MKGLLETTRTKFVNFTLKPTKISWDEQTQPIDLTSYRVTSNKYFAQSQGTFLFTRGSRAWWVWQLQWQRSEFGTCSFVHFDPASRRRDPEHQDPSTWQCLKLLYWTEPVTNINSYHPACKTGWRIFFIGSFLHCQNMSPLLNTT